MDACKSDVFELKSEAESIPEDAETTTEVDQPLWSQLEHRGPFFTKPYRPLPTGVGLLYDGELVTLSALPEEMAVAYAKLMHRKYTTEAHFKRNFFEDWKQSMSPAENAQISDFAKCDFQPIRRYLQKSGGRKLVDRKIKQEYGFCTVDGERTAVLNWSMEPPGLFKHKSSKTSKDGKWKARIEPEDVTINCSPGGRPPSPAGHHWKEVIENRYVAWLAQWDDPIDGSPKYMKLDPSATIKTNKDREKYDIARKLGDRIQSLRTQLSRDFKTSDIRKRQLVLAVCLIDLFAMKAADTDGWRALRVEHVELHDELNGETEVVELATIHQMAKIDHWAFLGLRSLLLERKPSELMFDLVSVPLVNRYLKNFMKTLTAKVFRTFRASATAEAELRYTQDTMSDREKMNIFHSAIQKVATMFNHRRSLPTVDLENDLFKVNQNIDQSRQELVILQQTPNEEWIQLKQSWIERRIRKKKELESRLQQALLQQSPLLDPSKEYEIDPRIVVAWCQNYGIPVQKIYTTDKHRRKFRWAISADCRKYVFHS